MVFTLKDDYIELCKLLKAANMVMSGGEGKEVVAQGMVTVDGELETRKRCKIRAGQTVAFEGSVIEVIDGTV
ncbi:RNA-binding S4 domain-containing protein [Pontiella agarivorans]|uniref:RNA-binding S4 domain-containing protein n=1 Tax=Pontiella agarivorans TaxID=3038953 RepID=A0ABU5MYH7_9BACT|nr:RNA-binding S4 domain-containing protein [Pontiella agarivorans]MDZ8119240.1 RNA-binding S4 domain-containing protein [Pontiella agarivorans]